MPHLLGLTGNIACGKTTIGKMLLALGAATYIDADAIVHELYLPHQPIYDAVVHTFGPDILTAEGQIDRKRLGTIVFNDPAQLQQLETITHPAVNGAIASRIVGLPADAVAVIDAVKLLEGGFGALCDGIWLVTCTVAEERRRLIEERHLTPEEADARLAAQPDNALRRSQFTEEIDNSATFAATQQQVSVAWARFQAKVAANQ